MNATQAIQDQPVGLAPSVWLEPTHQLQAHCLAKTVVLGHFLMQMVLAIALNVEHIRLRRKEALIGATVPATLVRPGIMARPAFYANRAATKQPLAANLVLIVNLASTQKTVGRQCAAAAKQEHSRHKMVPRQQVLAPIARHHRRRQRAARPALIVSATQAQLGLMAGTARAVMRASSSRSRARMLVASVRRARSRHKMAPRQQVLAPIARHRRRRRRAARPSLIVSATQAQLGLMAGTARAVMQAPTRHHRARRIVLCAQTERTRQQTRAPVLRVPRTPSLAAEARH